MREWRHSIGMNEDSAATIAAIIARAPEWIRRDLLSREESARTRAEEALAAMIANGLGDAAGSRAD